jgi:hypothetical protein
MPRSWSILIIVSTLGGWMIGPPAALAERNALEMNPPGTRLDIPERDLSPDRPATPRVRGFVAPLTKTTRTGEAGIAGWTAPNVPSGSRGAGDPDNSGWLGFGFAGEWGRPPRDRVQIQN